MITAGIIIAVVFFAVLIWIVVVSIALHAHDHPVRETSALFDADDHLVASARSVTPESARVRDISEPMGL
jgi:hypothetical protein